MPSGNFEHRNGWKFSGGIRKQMSIAKQGNKNALGKHWNLSNETKEKIKWVRNGKKFEDIFGIKKAKSIKDKMRLSAKKKKLTDEHKINIGLSEKGSKHWKWKGGITPINNKIRNSFKYKKWRTTIFKRDNYTCCYCNKKGIELVAHHIMPFAKYPSLRFIIDNGITLCEECHKFIGGSW
jgi:hypothetical protein